MRSVIHHGRVTARYTHALEAGLGIRVVVYTIPGATIEASKMSVVLRANIKRNSTQKMCIMIHRDRSRTDKDCELDYFSCKSLASYLIHLRIRQVFTLLSNMDNKQER